ncbi:quinone oxidoreductase-like protein 2 homolog [Periplaneta americana]|uniref:quinone oxidoreductase-like protein 2 homolog n=1 Tax=Periplaneta americana TaxID=6978 RepID=UPI0037E99D81
MAGTVVRKVFSTFLHTKSSTQPIYAISSQTGLRFKSKYKAAVIHELKQPLVIEEQKQKKLQKDEVRIKVKCCSVNASDIMICQGLYEVTPKLPFIPGYEVSGEILELDSKSEGGLKVGDRVIGLNKEHFSGFAEECILPSSDVWQLPSAIDFNTAAALADSYSTALIGLVRRGKLKQNDKVLITAAAGGLGLAAVDIAANVYRAKVIAVCDTEDKAALLRDRGAWAALTYSPKDIIKKCAEVTNGQGVKIVFESVGKDVFNSILKCVAPEGVVIVAGTASRLVPAINTSELLPSSFSLIGVSLRNYRRSNHDVYRQIIQDAIDMADQKLINPVVAKEFSLEKVNEAMQYVLDKKSTGKVIIKMKQDD